MFGYDQGTEIENGLSEFERSAIYSYMSPFVDKHAARQVCQVVSEPKWEY